MQFSCFLVLLLALSVASACYLLMASRMISARYEHKFWKMQVILLSSGSVGGNEPCDLPSPSSR